MKKNKQRFFYFLSPAVSLAHSDKKKKAKQNSKLSILPEQRSRS